MSSPNPFAGQGGSYTYDPVAEEWSQTDAPTAEAPPPATPTPPVLTTTAGELQIVTDQT